MNMNHHRAIQRLRLGRARVLSGWTQRTSRSADKDGNILVCVDQAIRGELITAHDSDDAYREASYWLTMAAYEIEEMEHGWSYTIKPFGPSFIPASYQHFNDRVGMTKEGIASLIDRAIELAQGPLHHHQERELSRSA